MEQRITAKTELLRVLPLAEEPAWLAVHEAKQMILGYSENCLATRVSELERAGLIIGRKRAGKSFKEWALSSGNPQSPFSRPTYDGFVNPGSTLVDQQRQPGEGE